MPTPTTFICPKCGNYLESDIPHEQYVCPHCGSRYNAADWSGRLKTKDRKEIATEVFVKKIICKCGKHPLRNGEAICKFCAKREQKRDGLKPEVPAINPQRAALNKQLYPHIGAFGEEKKISPESTPVPVKIVLDIEIRIRSVILQNQPETKA